MAGRENEVDYRPMWAPFGSISITANDSTVLSPVCRRVYVGGAGTITVRMLDGTTPQFTLAANTFLDIQFDQVKSTGTAATGIVGLY